MAAVTVDAPPAALSYEQGPPSITPANRPRRLRRRQPPTCPPKGRYRISEVAKLPNRIVHPGKLIEKDLLSKSTASDSRDVEKEAIDPYRGVTAGVVSCFAERTAVVANRCSYSYVSTGPRDAPRQAVRRDHGRRSRRKAHAAFDAPRL
jgi:hypothetical protein